MLEKDRKATEALAGAAHAQDTAELATGDAGASAGPQAAAGYTTDDEAFLVPADSGSFKTHDKNKEVCFIACRFTL